MLGKNGSGKSTIVKLIDACINNNTQIFSQYDHPYVQLTLSKEYENGDKQKVTVYNNKVQTDINSVLICTFDILTNNISEDNTYLDSKLQTLIDDFGKYQRSLTKIIAKKTENETKRSNEIRSNIATASMSQLTEYQELNVKIDNISTEIYKPITELKTIIDLYFKNTNKQIIVDDEKSPLLILKKDDENESVINTNLLSSGEKQLLIIFLTVILQKDKPFILLMDEPEASLHVEWQSTLIDDIHKIKPNIQVIIATHNPLMSLNRSNNEIGIIKHDKEEIETDNSGSKYLDISSILLKYFELPSLIGKDMQKDIEDLTKLKLKKNSQELDENEEQTLQNLIDLLDNSFAGEIIYNNKYFSFLKFLKDNKDIDIVDIDNIDEDEFQSFLQEFGGEIND